MCVLLVLFIYCFFDDDLVRLVSWLGFRLFIHMKYEQGYKYQCLSMELGLGGWARNSAEGFKVSFRSAACKLK